MDRNGDYKALRDAIDEVGRTFEELKGYVDTQIKAKADGKSIAELEATIERVNTHLGEVDTKRSNIEKRMEADRARIEELEALMATGGSIKSTQVLEEHAEAFFTFLAAGGTRNCAEYQVLKQAEKKYKSLLPEQKQVNLASAAAGEALVPEIISSTIEKMELKLSPVRRLISFVPVTSTDFKQVVDIGGTASGWLAETGTRSVTNSPSLRVRTPTWGELYARPQATEWAMMDIPGAMQWLATSVAEEFISAEGIAVISGNGTNKPTGIINTTPVSTADWTSPLRSAEALQFLAAPSPDDITEHLLMLIYGLNARYRTGAAFVMNSNTLALVRRAKDSNGQYLWQPSLQSGEPASIAGFGFEVWEDMPDVAQSPLSYPIAFGNWRRGYLAAQRSDISLLVDPYTTIGLVSFWFRRREGGIILNNNAIKLAKR